MTTTLVPPANRAGEATLRFADELCALSKRSLREMFIPADEFFIFTKRKTPRGIHPEGYSRRYTAITLLGLHGLDEGEAREILHGRSVSDVCGRLLRDVDTVNNLGDVALTLWVANLVQHPDRAKAAARLMQLDPVNAPHYVVEVAWAVSALCHDSSLPKDDNIRRTIAGRLMAYFAQRAELFPHTMGMRAPLRGHVGCFADQVYPIQALSFYSQAASDSTALDIANRTSGKICDLIGPQGQWWWHYDARTGRVVEGYPVYSVHQNSMAPMCLFASNEAGGDNHWNAIELGMNWLRHVPELGGKTLVDHENNAIWRKVCRREPNKLSRKLQAGVSALHPALRVPGLGVIFPPVAVDWECRPYHLGWILYAWNPVRMAALRRRFSGNAS